MNIEKCFHEILIVEFTVRSNLVLQFLNIESRPIATTLYNQLGVNHDFLYD